MATRTNAYNAYIADVTSGLAPGAVSLTVDAIPPTFVGPAYFVIDADDPSKREWIRVESFTGLTMNISDRGLQGSAGDDHAVGAKIESVTTSMAFNDIFNDINQDETNLANHEADSGDPHQPAGYLKLSDAEALFVERSGDTMAGPLILNADPTNDLGAATKQYVDDGPFVDKGGDTMTGLLTLSGAPQNTLHAATKQYVDDALSSGGLPSGTRMVFDQDAAPVGWTRDFSVNDKMIRIVSGTRVDGGTWTQPDHQHINPDTAAAGAHPHTISNHNHSSPVHSHTNPNTGTGTLAGGTAVGLEGGGSQFEYNIKDHSHAQGAVGNTAAVVNSGGPGTTQSNGDHTHNIQETGGGATVDTWRPLNRQMIIGVKD